MCEWMCGWVQMRECVCFCLVFFYLRERKTMFARESYWKRVCEAYTLSV